MSITVCPLKDLDTSALSVSPRRLTEGFPRSEEGSTSADAGLTSCLLVNAELVFRRLHLLDGKIFLVGMTQGGGFKMQKRFLTSGELQGATKVTEKLQELPEIGDGQAAGNSGQ